MSSSAHEWAPCPCPPCDRETIHPDEYCLACQDAGCGADARCRYAE